MFVNYGDVNFFEYGCLVDIESNTEFRIMYCRPVDDSDGKYAFGDCYVDIEDSWINKEDVMSYIGMTEDDFNPIEYAIGCIEFYGMDNFDIYCEYDKDKESICEILRNRDIDTSDLNVEW